MAANDNSNIINANMINANNNPNSYFSNHFNNHISNYLSNYGQTLDGYKELMNQNILAIAPESWHPFLSSILPAHWQEWLLPFYQLFIHTETVGKLPKWVEYIFDTPSNHRAHHGTKGAYIDQNYGGVLIIFDRWFGTYVEEDALNNPVNYGAIGEVSHDNIFTLIFSVFYRMWQRFWRTKGVKNKLKVLFSPPSNAQ